MKMKSKTILFGLLTLALSFGMAAAGCNVSGESPYTPTEDNVITSVSVTGSAKGGTTVEARAKNSSGSRVSAAYQWKRGSSQSGAYIAISGATASNYMITAEDTDQYLKVEVTNSDTPSPVSSDALGPVDANKVEKPTVDPADTEVASGQEITLASGTESVNIYYTLDGSTPTSNSTRYASNSKPQITTNCTLKAIAVYYGMVDSDILEVTYTVASIAWSSVTTNIVNKEKNRNASKHG
jgi:hypothetical protein